MHSSHPTSRIDVKSISKDKSGVLQKVEDRLNLLRQDKPIIDVTDLLSVEERSYLAFLSWCLQKKSPGGAGRRAFFTVFRFISFHGIIMTSDQQRGSGSVWKTPY